MKIRCTIPTCKNTADSLGLCTSHYQADYRKKNKAKLTEYYQAYRNDNLERLREYDRQRTPARKEWKQTYDRQFRYQGRGRYKKTMYQAKKRGIDFTLTLEQFHELVSRPCEYCEVSHETMTIDRIDSSLGYTPENCAPACRPCNTMKWVLSLDEFEKHIARVHETFQRKISKTK